MFLEAPSNILLNVHSNRTEVLVSMGNDDVGVAANLL